MRAIDSGFGLSGLVAAESSFKLLTQPFTRDH